MRRRRFLASTVSTSLLLAGCRGDSGGDGGAGGDGGGSGGSGGSGGTATTTTATADESETLAGHPAATDLAAQPTLGPAPSDATATIVAYEDPSCPRCANFETEVVPTLRSDYVEPGDLSLVFRGYPVVYDWGKPATRALEAAFDRSAAAHWALAEHYFETQDDFSDDDLETVYPKTESFLAESTDLDAATVVEEANAGAYDGAVRTDLDAGMEAGAKSITPHLFLFRDGVYQTTVTGYVGVDVITSALQL
jgi:protein-disulfide isomerase